MSHKGILQIYVHITVNMLDEIKTNKKMSFTPYSQLSFSFLILPYRNISKSDACSSWNCRIHVLPFSLDHTPKWCLPLSFLQDCCKWPFCGHIQWPLLRLHFTWPIRSIELLTFSLFYTAFFTWLPRLYTLQAALLPLSLTPPSQLPACFCSDHNS